MTYEQAYEKLEHYLKGESFLFDYVKVLKDAIDRQNELLRILKNHAYFEDTYGGTYDCYYPHSDIVIKVYEEAGEEYETIRLLLEENK